MVEVNITDIILLFAVFYIIAVIVERLIEFFAVIIDIIVENSIKFSFKGFIYLSKLSKFFFGDKAKIEENKRMTENRQKLINGITSLSKELPTDTSMDELKSEIKPPNIKVAYQRPCSSRLSPDKYHFVGEIFDLIGAELVEREYQGENALCCGEVIRLIDLYEVANDIQRRNIDDMVESEAEYCVFNCPYCQMALSEKVSKRGVKPIHIIDLCKMAIGEK